jgi:hypothetical protein
VFHLSLADDYMPYFISHHAKYGRSPFGFPFLGTGLVLTCTGLAILAAPELLAYFVATIFLLIGISLLSYGWKMRK